MEGSIPNTKQTLCICSTFDSRAQWLIMSDYMWKILDLLTRHRGLCPFCGDNMHVRHITFTVSTPLQPHKQPACSCTQPQQHSLQRKRERTHITWGGGETFCPSQQRKWSITKSYNFPVDYQHTGLIFWLNGNVSPVHTCSDSFLFLQVQVYFQNIVTSYVSGNLVFTPVTKITNPHSCQSCKGMIADIMSCVAAVEFEWRGFHWLVCLFFFPRFQLCMKWSHLLDAIGMPTWL